MSSIWTPGGERPVGRDDPADQPREQPREQPHDLPGSAPAHDEELTPEEVQARMAEVREELAKTPTSEVVANHCLGLFELAALHLSLQPPQLEEAQLAIDALGALVEGLSGRLGEQESQLSEALAQLRLAFVQIRAAT
jgi:hypothetical protein